MTCHIEKCKCGADGRLRKSGSYVWVECKKKCGRTSGYIHNTIDEDDARFKDGMETCIQFAIERWNGLVKKDG